MAEDVPEVLFVCVENAGRSQMAAGLLDELAAKLGSQAVVLAVDAAGGEVYARAGGEPTGRRAVDWAREGERERLKRASVRGRVWSRWAFSA